MAPMIRGDHLFEGDADFHGMILGDVTIAPGATVHLRSMVKGDVLVSAGARVDLLGMVKGDVTLEQGAHLLLAGMVGQIINRGGSVDYAAP